MKGDACVQPPALPDSSLSLRYGLSYAAIFFVLGVLGPFMSLFLNHQGFGAATIGLLLAIGGPVRVVAGPLMGWVADSGVPLRRLLAVAQIVTALAMLAMMAVTQAPVMALLMALLYAAHGPLSAMVDASLSQAILQRTALDYARIRLWGSLAFIAGNLIGGRAADISPLAIPMLAIAGLLAGACVAFALPRTFKRREAAAGEVNPVPSTTVWISVIALVAAAAAIQSSHSAIYTISALAWSAQGLSQSMTGFLWTLGVLVEVVLFYRIGRSISGLRRALVFMLLGGIVAVARWLLMAEQPGLAVTMLLQLAHGLTFGATHLGTIAALAVLSPDGFRSRIQGSLAAAQALASSVGIYWTGVLYQAGGAAPAYRLMACYAGFGLILLAGLAWRLRGDMRDG